MKHWYKYRVNPGIRIEVFVEELQSILFLLKENPKTRKRKKFKEKAVHYENTFVRKMHLHLCTQINVEKKTIYKN